MLLLFFGDILNNIIIRWFEFTYLGLFGSRWSCLDVSVGVEVSVSWSVRLVAVPRTEDSLR